MWMQWASVIYGFSLIILFSNFYFQAYIKSKHQRKTKQVGVRTQNQAGSIHKCLC